MVPESKSIHLLALHANLDQLFVGFLATVWMYNSSDKLFPARTGVSDSYFTVVINIENYLTSWMWNRGRQAISLPQTDNVEIRKKGNPLSFSHQWYPDSISEVVACLAWGFRWHGHYCQTHTHALTSVCHTTPTLLLPSMGWGWVQISPSTPLLLEKCQSLQLPCREVEEEGGRKGEKIETGKQYGGAREWGKWKETN